MTLRIPVAGARVLVLAFVASMVMAGLQGAPAGRPDSASGASPATISLVSERDQIEGGMLGSQSVYADRDRIYLATSTGKLYVLARDREADFPVIEVVQDTTTGLTAVRGDAKNLYVTAKDGMLRVYRKDDPLVLVDTVSLTQFSLSSLAVTQQDLYVGVGQAEVVVDGRHVYMSHLNPGEVVVQVSKKTLSPGLVYGESFEERATVVFDRKSGERITSIPNPIETTGLPSQAVRLYLDKKILAQTVAGCCGPGIFLYEPKTLASDTSVQARRSTNTVTRVGRVLVGGNEGGQVDVYDLSQDPAPLVSSADLRQLTGHTGVEDIEIRALWADHFDNLVFAGSSWGNDESRGPDLPSFFVLELTR